MRTEKRGTYGKVRIKANVSRRWLEGTPIEEDLKKNDTRIGRQRNRTSNWKKSPDMWAGCPEKTQQKKDAARRESTEIR